MKTKKILIAISGWVDSIFLLNFLEQQFPKDNLVIGHFNHNLRWKESDLDEEFVWKISEEKWVKFFSEKAELNLIKSEDDARKFRYEFLRKTAEQENCDFIATAHHKNDQIETLFLQLVRWTANFSPMKEFVGNDCIVPKKWLQNMYQCNWFLQIWRPLLNFTKKEILDFAEKNNLKWREDSTNLENIFTRNKIRNEIFPELEKLNKNFWENLVNLAKISWENFSYLEKILDEKIQKIFWWEKIFFDEKKFSKKFFDELDISLKKILVKKIFEKNKDKFRNSFSSENISEVILMIEKWEWKKEKHWFFLEKWVVYFWENNF